MSLVSRLGISTRAAGGAGAAGRSGAKPPPLPSGGPKGGGAGKGFNLSDFISGGGGGGPGGGKGGSNGAIDVNIVSPLPLPVQIVSGGMSSGGSGGSSSGGMNVDKLLGKDATKIFDEMTKLVDGGKNVINNDFVGLFNAMDSVPEPIKKFVNALDGAAKAIIERTRELSGYDGKLASATANRDVQLFMADVREAKAVGKSYANVTDQYTQLEISLRDAFNPLKEAIANGLGKILEIVNLLEKFSGLEERIVIISTILNNIVSIATGDYEKLLETIKNFPSAIADAIAGRNKDKGDMLFENIFENNREMFKQRNEKMLPKGDANVPMNFGIINM